MQRVLKKLTIAGVFCFIIYSTSGISLLSVRQIGKIYELILSPRVTLASGEPYNVPLPGIIAGTVIGAAGGLSSTANDLVKYYLMLMEGWNQKGEDRESPEHRLSDDVFRLFSPLQIMETPAYREKSYASGWARTQLPTSVGDIGVNPGLLDRMPRLGDGISSRLVSWHQGSLVGATCFVMLLPETDSLVLVLTNTIALNDAADWMGQLLVEVLLQSPVRHDYVALASVTSQRALDKLTKLGKDIDDRRSRNGPGRDLSEYVGMYSGLDGLFRIHIEHGGDDRTLETLFQGREPQKFTLRHYYDDVFTWFLPWDEQIKRPQFISSNSAITKCIL